MNRVDLQNLTFSYDFQAFIIQTKELLINT